MTFISQNQNGRRWNLSASSSRLSCRRLMTNCQSCFPGRSTSAGSWVILQKKADAICCELSAIKDQESLDAQEQEALRVICEQEASQTAAPLSFEDIFSSETLASLELLSLSDLVTAGLLGGNPPASGSSQS